MFDRNLLKLPGMTGVLGALAILALLQAAAVIGQAYALSTAISQLWEGAPVEQATPPLAAFFICFTVMQVIRFAQETMLDRFSQARAEALRNQVIEQVFDKRTMLAMHQGSTLVAALATDGIDEVQSYLRIIPPKIIGMAALSIPILICEFVIDWPSGIILAVMFPVIMFFMILLGKQARERADRQYASYMRLTNRFIDTLRGMRVIKSLKATQGEAQSAYRYSENLREVTVKTLQTATLSSAVLDLCATFGVAAVAMMLAFRLLDGSIALYTGLFALILAPEYFSPIRSFASDYHASLDGKNALASVLSLISNQALPPQRTPELNPAHETERTSAATSGPSASAHPLVELSDVSFAYGDAGRGVAHINLRAQGPQIVALVGQSGSGKTTLANLIAGFSTPTEGRLNAPPVRYIPQHPYVFRATLAENVSFYSPNASRAQIEAAVEAVGLDTLASELPNGLDTTIGEGARGLSGGQAHRIALARIMLDTEANVLVFDEPTAHLDIETELDLKETMLEIMKGKLVFLATHRLHWLDDVDRVITLDDGRLVRDEVLA